MKTFFRIICIGLLVVLFSEFSFAKEFNFRKTNWGMSIAQVKSSEPPAKWEGDGNRLLYKTNVIGKDVIIAYYFVDNQLVRAEYVLVDNHTNLNDFIGDYTDFEEILIKKYGKPKRDEQVWRNDLFKEKHSDWGMAISVGHLMYYSSWETQDTEIDILLMGENYIVKCVVEYRSKNLKAKEKKAREKKALDVF
ncbi:MAG: hypothetical protein P9M13_05470 [Candidatus Ancaeobacter aquaticus]|nr:hypothetical protein [Candidatus Ancaeobacter aquaticus]